MATRKDWKIDHSKDLAGTFAADVSEGQVIKLTAERTFDVAGAGDIPAGVAFRDVDISEDGAKGEIMRSHIAVIPCAAAITDITLPVKVAAAGTCTPVTADLDVILGKPLNLQSTVGGDVAVDLTLMGSFYGSA